jgi:hypothetical protein
MADAETDAKPVDQDALVADIDRTRAELARTIDAISDRVSPNEPGAEDPPAPPGRPADSGRRASGRLTALFPRTLAAVGLPPRRRAPEKAEF